MWIQVTKYGDLGVFNEILYILLKYGCVFDPENGALHKVEEPGSKTLVIQSMTGVTAKEILPALAFVECEEREVKQETGDSKQDKYKDTEMRIPPHLRKLWERLCFQLRIDTTDAGFACKIVEDELAYVMTLQCADFIAKVYDRVEHKIPVLLRGDTGVGKSQLMKVLSRLNCVPSIKQTRKKLVEFLNSHISANFDCLMTIDELYDQVDKHFRQDENRPKIADFVRDLEVFLQEQGRYLPCYDGPTAKKPEGKQAPFEDLIMWTEKEMKSFGSSYDKLYKHIVMDAHITPENFARKIKKLNKKVKEYKAKVERQGSTENFRMVLFIDECTSTKVLGMVEELIIERRLNGKKLEDHLVCIGAYNTNDEQSSKGCAQIEQYRNAYTSSRERREELKEFAVEPPPDSFNYYEIPFNFAPTPAKLEKMVNKAFQVAYVNGRWKELVERANAMLREEGKKKEDALLNENEDAAWLAKWLTRAFVKFSEFRHRRVHPSIRDVMRSVRFVMFFLSQKQFVRWLRDQVQKSGMESVTTCRMCLMLSVYLCYYLRLPDSCRGDFIGELFDEAGAAADQAAEIVFDTFMPAMACVTKAFAKKAIEQYQSQTGCSGLKPIVEFNQNIFALVCSLHAGVPVLIAGPPGCGKTQSWNVAQLHMNGQLLHEDWMLDDLMCVKADRVQCSKNTTDADVRRSFSLLNDRREALRGVDQTRVRYALLMDEASLVDNSEAPLKTLHQQLDYPILSTREDRTRVHCAVLSNCVLDAAKTNRMVLVVQQTIASNLDNISNILPQSMNGLAQLPRKANEAFAQNYGAVIFNGQRYHMRELFYFTREMQELQKQEQRISKRQCLGMLSRQFGGMDPYVYDGLADFVQRSLHQEPDEAGKSPNRIVFEELLRCLKRERSSVGPGQERYLAVIDDSENNALVDTIERIFGAPGAGKVVQCNVTDYQKDRDDDIHQEIIKAVTGAMQQGQTCIITNPVPVCTAFYTLFNLENVTISENQYAYVAIGPTTLLYYLNPQFNVVVVFTRSQLEATPTALMDRFMKIYVTQAMMLECALAQHSTEARAVEECMRECKKLVSQCTPAALFGYRERSTVESIMLMALRRDSSFSCPDPYQHAASLGDHRTKKKNIWNALRMLMLIARSDVLPFNAIDQRIHEEFEKQCHSSAEAFLKSLQEHHASRSLLWHVYVLQKTTHSGVEQLCKKLGNRVYMFNLNEHKCKEETVDKCEEIKRKVEQQQQQCKEVPVVICWVDMEMCEPSVINFARKKLEELRHSAYVALLQSFGSVPQHSTEQKVSSVFTQTWRYVCVTALLEPSQESNKIGKASETSAWTVECKRERKQLLKQKEVYQHIHNNVEVSILDKVEKEASKDGGPQLAKLALRLMCDMPYESLKDQCRRKHFKDKCGELLQKYVQVCCVADSDSAWSKAWDQVKKAVQYDGSFGDTERDRRFVSDEDELCKLLLRIISRYCVKNKQLNFDWSKLRTSKPLHGDEQADKLLLGIVQRAAPVLLCSVYRGLDYKVKHLNNVADYCAEVGLDEPPQEVKELTLEELWSCAVFWCQRHIHMEHRVKAPVEVPDHVFRLAKSLRNMMMLMVPGDVKKTLGHLLEIAHRRNEIGGKEPSPQEAELVNCCVAGLVAYIQFKEKKWYDSVHVLAPCVVAKIFFQPTFIANPIDHVEFGPSKSRRGTAAQARPNVQDEDVAEEVQDSLEDYDS